ncbi:MAG: polysaccharide deacetylase family protein [Lachnospiraceae bacterium]|nr:polysaccharide deacetylase family protein [Lachnospiraceae bacterium]
MALKPKLVIQVDCDSEFVMQKHYGLSSYKGDTYYSALEIFVDKFKKADLKGTLFVVGRDMEKKSVQPYILNALKEGHEIANHSYGHPNKFSTLADKNFQTEVQKTNHIVYSAFRIKCKGFRAPNFDINPSQIKILETEGFQYDCSIIKTPYLPVIKLLKGIDASKSGYMGNKQLALRKYNSGGIIRIPITTFPYMNFPCHFSYLLASNVNIAELIMTKLIKWHIKNRKPLIYLFHLADLVDNSFLYGTELKYYKSLEKRLLLLDSFIKMVAASFESITTGEYCGSLKSGGA